MNVGKEVADQDLARQGRFDHARQFDRHIADDEVVHGRIQTFRLVELVACADMKTRAQSRHSFCR